MQLKGTNYQSDEVQLGSNDEIIFKCKNEYRLLLLFGNYLCNDLIIQLEWF